MRNKILIIYNFDFSLYNPAYSLSKKSSSSASSKKNKVKTITPKDVDAVTKATETIEPLKLKEEAVKEETVKEEAVKEEAPKVEPKKVEEKKSRRFIDFADDSLKNLSVSEIEKESTMTIFNFDSDMPVSSDVSELNLSSEQTVWYKAKNFIPGTIDDFFKANPVFILNGSKVIMPGKNNLENALGEKIFATAYNLYKINEIEKAKTIFEKLINYNHRVLESYYYLGWCYFINKDYYTSILYLKEAVKNAEKNNVEAAKTADYYYQIGTIYLKLEDYSNAINNINIAIEKSPMTSGYYNNLGIIYYKLGDFSNAKRFLV